MPQKVRPLAERLMSRVQVDDNGCWIWTGPFHETGYGVIGEGMRGGRILRTHRVSYELHVGPIPDGLVLDHLCRVTACCNPEHLEPVTTGENVRRGVRKTQQTHCKRGHEFTPENTRTSAKQRVCLTCQKATNERYEARKKARA